MCPLFGGSTVVYSTSPLLSCSLAKESHKGHYNDVNGYFGLVCYSIPLSMPLKYFAKSSWMDIISNAIKCPLPAGPRIYLPISWGVGGGASLEPWFCLERRKRTWYTLSAHVWIFHRIPLNSILPCNFRILNRVWS